ncbi:hypothetical protein ACAW63_22665 [Pseudomonas sp. QE6]|uniref:hypothetical protein n=1 Tax=Pseudomonas sp. QE6 TaxID=3242491 RepID=UPI0035272516
MRVFRNPANGHTEQVSTEAWLYVVIFGAFYLAYRGLWVHFFVWMVVVGVLTAGTGGPGLIIALPIVTIGYGVSIQGILAKSYLRKGWEEVVDTTLPGATQSPHTGSGLRECPFCAELIKMQAIKCKHCGSDVEPVKAEEPVYVHPLNRVYNKDGLVRHWVIALPFSTKAEYEKVKEGLILTGIPVHSETSNFLRVGSYPAKDEAGRILRKLMQNSLHGNIEEFWVVPDESVEATPLHGRVCR